MTEQTKITISQMIMVCVLSLCLALPFTLPLHNEANKNKPSKKDINQYMISLKLSSEYNTNAIYRLPLTDYSHLIGSGIR